MSTCAVLSVALLSGSSGFAESWQADRAKAIVEQARQPVAFTFKGPPFSPAKARGAMVYYINGRDYLPSAQVWSSTVQTILEKYGVRLKIFDGHGSEGAISNALSEALLARPSGIVTVGVEPRVVAAFESRAHRLQIPFLTFHASASHGSTPVAYPVEKLGRFAAAWVIAQGTEHRDCCLGIISNALDPELADLSAAFAEGWGDFNGRTDYDPPGDWSTTLPKMFRDSLSVYVPGGHRYFVCVDDRMAVPMVEEAARLHDSKGRIVVFNPSARSLELIQQGTALKVAVGSPNRWIGYAMADQILRALTGNPLARDEEIPVRLFDTENVSSINFRDPEEGWYGPVDLEARYREIWSGPDTGTPLPVIQRPKPPHGPCAKFLEAGFDVVIGNNKTRYRAFPDLRINDPDPMDAPPRCDTLGTGWDWALSDVVKLVESLRRHGPPELLKAMKECGVKAWYGPKVCAPCAYRGPLTPPCPCAVTTVSNWAFCAKKTAVDSGAPPPLLPSSFTTRTELAVWRSRAELPKWLAPSAPIDFDFSRFELAGHAFEPTVTHSVMIDEPTSAGAQLRHERWGTVVHLRPVEHCHGAYYGPGKPITNVMVTLWKLPRSKARVYLEQEHCPPLAGIDRRKEKD